MRVYIDTGEFARLCVPFEGWIALKAKRSIVSINHEAVDDVSRHAKSFTLQGYKLIVIDYNVLRQQFDVMLDSPYARLVAFKAKLSRLYWNTTYIVIGKLIDLGIVHVEQGSTAIKWGRK